MSEAKHTPGPWSVVAGDNYMVESDRIPDKYPHRFPGDDLGRFVAFVGNRQPDFGEADAKLIAAAPDLLEACELMIEAMVAYEFDVDDCPTPRHRSLMEFVRNTIAKAKGELE